MNNDIELVKTALAEYDRVAGALAELSKRYDGIVFDVSKPTGLKDAKDARAALRVPRYEIEKIRKGAKAPILALGKQIDSEASRITSELMKLEEPIDRQIKTHEERLEAERAAKVEAELKRVEAIKERIEDIRSPVEPATRFAAKAADIAVYIRDTENHVIDEFFEEYRQQADEVKTATLAKLRDAHTAALAREEEKRKADEAQAELAKLRAEAAAREANDRAEREERERQERLKREAEEKAAREKREADEKAAREKLAAEQAERARLQKIEQDRIDAENRKLAAERAEFERQQEEARRKAAEEERQRQIAAEAERKRKEEAERLAKKAKFPGENSIVDALMEHFGVPEAVVKNWLSQLRAAA